MEALAKHLIVRGHRVTFFQQEEARTLLTEPQAHFIAVGNPVCDARAGVFSPDIRYGKRYRYAVP